MFGILAQTAQPAPDVPRVVERARAYVVDYERKLSGVVVEETYEQTSRELRPFANPTTLRPPDVQRKLKSDLLLVKPEGAEHWIQFRDVFDVDGRPIRDRSEDAVFRDSRRQPRPVSERNLVLCRRQLLRRHEARWLAVGHSI